MSQQDSISTSQILIGIPMYSQEYNIILCDNKARRTVPGTTTWYVQYYDKQQQATTDALFFFFFTCSSNNDKVHQIRKSLIEVAK